MYCFEKKRCKKREKIQNNRLRTPVGKSPLCVTFSRKNVFELFFPFMCKKKKNVGKTRLRPGFCRKKFSKENGARLLRTPILLKFSRIAPSKRFMCTIDFFSEKGLCVRDFCRKKKISNWRTSFVYANFALNLAESQQTCVLFLFFLRQNPILCTIFVNKNVSFFSKK